MKKSQQLFFRLTVLVWIALACVIIYHQWIHYTSGDHPSVLTHTDPVAKKPEPKLSNVQLKKQMQASEEEDHSYSSRVEKAEDQQQQKKKSISKAEKTKTSLSGSSPISSVSSYNSNKPKTIEDFHQSLSWKQFVESRMDPYSSPLQLPHNLAESLKICPAEVVDKLYQRMSDEDLQWCKWALSPSGGKVKVGKSYGTLNGPDRDRYEQLNCNAVDKGENPSCDDAWGDGAISSWKKNIMPEQCGEAEQYTSRITCRESRSMAKVCVFDNALIDFQKLTNVKRPGRSDSRKWGSGFISSHCDAQAHGDLGYYHFIRPMTAKNPLQDVKCDYIINKTVVIYGHDDPHNVGHSMSDFMNVWAMLWLAGLGAHGKDILFLNTDAIREGHNYYDDLGALQAHYDHQFAGVFKAHDFYQQNKPNVCVKRLLVQPQPVILFTWDGWWQDMRCSFVGPSSLFQRWNVQIRNIYQLLPGQANEQIVHRGPKSMAISASDAAEIRVLLVHRVIAGGNAAPMYTSRVIANIGEVSNALNQTLLSRKSSVPTRLIVQDLAKLSFVEQVHLLSSVDLVIGVHGAGIPNAMHMSIGQRPHCCSVIEIFPQGEFFPIRGYGNMARRMGLKYQRMELDAAASGSHGAKLPVSQLVAHVERLLDGSAVSASCVLPTVLSDPYFDSIPVKL